MSDEETQYFHAEDEVFLKSAEHVEFQFLSPGALEEQNLKTSGLLMLIERSKFEGAIGDMETFLSADSS